MIRLPYITTEIDISSKQSITIMLFLLMNLKGTLHFTLSKKVLL